MKLSIKPLVLVFAATALAAVAVMFRNGIRVHDDADGEHPSVNIASESARLDAMETRLLRIEQMLASISARSESGLVRAQPPAQHEEQEASITTPAILKHRTMATYEAQFSSQRVDTRWAPKTETHLLDKMQTEHMLSIHADMPEQREIDCRSNMCRMQFVFSDQADARDWSEAYLTGMGNGLARLWYTVEPKSNGKTEVLIYGFRSR